MSHIGGLDFRKKKKNSHFLEKTQPGGGGSGEAGMVSQLLPVLNYDSFPYQTVKINIFCLFIQTGVMFMPELA